MMPSTASRERLAALGIDVWVRRDRRIGDRPARNQAAQPAAESISDLGGGSVSPEATATAAVPRVRMASGDGDWLLVQGAPWDGRHDVLLGDIQATIGSARCRFGQWAHSDSAGVSVDELNSRGVQHVLVFGNAPVEAGVHLVPELSQLATSARARRHLWRILAGALQD